MTDIRISELPALGSVATDAHIPVSQASGTSGTLVTGKVTLAQAVAAVPPQAHAHTPAQVGLGNVANLAPPDLPVSTATANALASAIGGHLSAIDPHPQYTTTVEAAAAAPVQSVAGRTGAVALSSADVGLALVPNVAPDDWPISDAAQAALDDKLNVGAKIPAADVTGLGAVINAAIATNGVTSVNGQQGDVVLGKADVGLGNVANLAPTDLPISTATATALALKLDAGTVGVSVASLVAGKVPASQLPDPTAGRKVIVADQAARLALPVWDDLTIAYQSSDSTTWGLDADANPSVAGNWTLMGSTAVDGVSTFNGRTGVVVPQTGDYTAAQVGADAAGVAASSMATHLVAADPHPQYATAVEAAAAAPVQSVNGMTGSVTITKASIGLGSVDNTSDANKPVSTAQQTAIGEKVDKIQARLDGRIHEKLNPLGSVAGSASINLAGGSYVTATATGACTWTFSGTLAGYATAFTLQLENGGLGAQGFPATPMGTAPTLQSAGVDVLVFVHDGTAWRYAKAGA